MTGMFRGKILKTNYLQAGLWVYGSYIPMKVRRNIYKPVICDRDNMTYIVDPATVGQNTELTDKNNQEIFKGDITELILESGEIRRFVVDIRTVTRTVVSHPDFDDETAKVQITGVVFLWQGYELFPCIDSNGVSDVSKMKIIGNIHDNPELVKEEAE